MADRPVRIGEALLDAQRRGLARLDAQLLLAHLLQRPRTWLLAHDDEPLEADRRDHWAELVEQRLDSVPLAYLTGQHEFFGLPLRVTPDVLDPRPDTETLVEWALEQLAAQPVTAAVLDLGTGSGAIALAIAHRCPDARVTGVDASEGALAVARDNGQRLALPVRWCAGDWFGPVAGERFDLIVANPPYLAETDPHLPALRHEPRGALCAGQDGLDDLRRIAEGAPHHLAPDGWLLLEHGHEQAEAVAGLLRDQGFVDVGHRRDLADRPRCTGGRLPDLRDRG